MDNLLQYNTIYLDVKCLTERSSAAFYEVIFRLKTGSVEADRSVDSFSLFSAPFKLTFFLSLLHHPIATSSNMGLIWATKDQYEYLRQRYPGFCEAQLQHGQQAVKDYHLETQAQWLKKWPMEGLDSTDPEIRKNVEKELATIQAVRVETWCS